MENLVGKEVITVDGHRGQVIKHFYATSRGMVVHIQECDGRIWGCPESDILEILGGSKWKKI